MYTHKLKHWTMGNTYDTSRLNPKLKPRLEKIKNLQTNLTNRLSMSKQIDKSSKFKQS